MTLADPRAHTQVATRAEWAEEYASRAGRRAVKAWQHASEARAQAEQDAIRVIATSNRSTVARQGYMRARRHVSSNQRRFSAIAPRDCVSQYSVS
jgi:hypothetical protein